MHVMKVLILRLILKKSILSQHHILIFLKKPALSMCRNGIIHLSTVTDFYRWSEDEYIDLYLSVKKELSSLIKSVGKAPKMAGYSIENMQQFCMEHDAYIQRKKEVVKKIQDIFYEN